MSPPLPFPVQQQPQQRAQMGLRQQASGLGKMEQQLMIQQLQLLQQLLVLTPDDQSVRGRVRHLQHVLIAWSELGHDQPFALQYQCIVR